MNGRISKNVAKQLRTNENLLLILVDKSLNMKPAKVWTFESTFNHARQKAAYYK